MVDVALLGLGADRVDALDVRGRAERRDRQDLGLAAGEQAGAVGARQEADLDRDLAQLGQAAAVHPDALVEGELAGGLLVDEAEQALADARLAAGGLEQRLAVATGRGWPGTSRRSPVLRVVDPTRQVVAEPDQQVGGRLGVGQRPDAPGRARCRRSSTASAACSSRGPDSPRGRSSGCRGSGPARCACRRRARPRGSRGRSRPSDRRSSASPMNVEGVLARRRPGLGAFLTSASVMPCIWLPMIGRPGLTSVDQRSVILPPLTLTAAISTRSAIFGSVPVVSTSTTTNSSPASTALAKSRTEPVPASRNGVLLALPTALLELLLDVDERLQGAVAEQDRLGHDVLGQELGARLDHHDRVARAGDDQVELRVRELAEGRVDDELAVDAADRGRRRRGRRTGSR